MASKRSPDKRQLMVETHSQADLHQLLVPSSFEHAPPVPRKDSPPSPSRTGSAAESYFDQETLSRTNSVFSFSRASLSSQLANLSSMSLPQAESLAASIAALPTAPKAVKALTAAAEQIQQWTKKALKVLENLDADDDVEWAAAAGRDALDETEKCINKFETLISVYVQAIEELQIRPDIGDIKPEEFAGVVEQMESVLEGWDNVRQGLKSIHDQVELAMEWEELWGTVLGDVGNELDSLSQLVFEMEEKRHTALFMPKQQETPNVDLNELESIIETPAKSALQNNRFSLIPTFESSPLGSPIIENSQDDSNLLALFARMQPLRASLDFLPIRTSMFQSRAEKIFPQACQELEDKRERLEKNWSQLSKEAENLRKELSEDRWVVVFRNAGRQAQKMMDSIERSVEKVQEGIEAGYERSNPNALGKRIESFEAKRLHYAPAIQRVLTIINKGLSDRLTVNGEIIRLHKDISSKSRIMSEMMEDMESLLEMMSSNHNSRLRESISSVMSTNRSFSSTTFVDTPVSSPASSVDLGPSRNGRVVSKYGMNGYSKPRAPSANRPPSALNNRRTSLQPRQPSTPMHSQNRQHMPRRTTSPSPQPASVYRQGVYQPPTAPLPARPTTDLSKPRWSSVAKPSDTVPGHSSRSSSLSTVSPLNRMTPRSVSSSSAIPFPSPLSREQSASPSNILGPPVAIRGSQQFRSFAERVASPSPPQSGSVMDPLPYHRGRNVVVPVVGTIRSPSSLTFGNTSPPTISSSAQHNRPPSAVGISYAPRQPMPMRTSTEPPRPSHRSEDSAIDLEADDFENEDHQIPDQDSSPTIRPTISPRPVSVLGMNGKGKRISMLPVPARVSSSGRQSSLGNRAV